MLTAEEVVEGYRAGRFVMGNSAQDPKLTWHTPDLRGYLPLQEFHIPKRLRRSLRHALHNNSWEIRLDTSFEQVLAACAEATDKRPNTWINPEITRIFTTLFEQEIAHTVEVWSPEGTLIGGLYGVALEGAFFGESMFSRVPNASKYALLQLVARLRLMGFTLLDIQFFNPFFVQFGEQVQWRQEYEENLAVALNRNAIWIDLDSLSAKSAFNFLINQGKRNASNIMP
ncbi:Leucyl/phenylalanyl-tRNA--protein transferase [uncultured Gammaproteobacteria bacterium]